MCSVELFKESSAFRIDFLLRKEEISNSTANIINQMLVISCRQSKKSFSTKFVCVWKSKSYKSKRNGDRLMSCTQNRVLFLHSLAWLFHIFLTLIAQNCNNNNLKLMVWLLLLLLLWSLGFFFFLKKKQQHKNQF